MSNLTQQAIDLRERMGQIRCDLAGNVSHLTHDARTLTDYRYYFRRFPWLSVGAATAVGFLLIPRKAKPVKPDPELIKELLKKNQLVVQSKSDSASKQGLIATGVSLLAGAGMRMALNYAQQRAMAHLDRIKYGDVEASRYPGSYPSQPR